jgi:3-oxoacid CoA-transferase subunit A
MLSSLGAPQQYVFEEAIRADYAFVRAAVGDRHGNLVFEKSARNFNPLAAMSGRVTVAEVDRIVEPGMLHPDSVHLSGIYVDRIVELSADEASELPIEKTTVSSGVAD